MTRKPRNVPAHRWFAIPRGRRKAWNRMWGWWYEHPGALAAVLKEHYGCGVGDAGVTVIL